jgi:Superfamily II helicase
LKTVRILEVRDDEVLVEMDSGVGKFKMENPRLEGFPFERLNPLQFVFYRFYLLEDAGKNVLVVAPTSSGKTGVAMLFMGGRGTYAVPTRALANEIYQNFVRVFGKDKVGLRTGDVFEEVLEDRDITVCTYESLANGLRTNKSWVKSPFVIDEIHHIYKERGVV